MTEKLAFTSIATTIRNNNNEEEERAVKRAFLDRLKQNDDFMSRIKVKKCAPVLGADYVAFYECTIKLADEDQNTEEEADGDQFT